MKFIKKLIFLALILCLIVINNRAQVESVLNLRKFSVRFYKNTTERVNGANKDFKKKVLLDQHQQRAEEMEKKRQEIYKDILLKRVYAPILKDFYNRF